MTMLRVVIIEDEAPAATRLADLLRKLEQPCDVLGIADSVASARRLLRTSGGQNAPELIFADIQLGDGLSLDLFRESPPPCPVVFTTAHDDYVLEAFATHGIAYLLKPVKPAELAAAVGKYRELGRHFTGNVTALATALTAPRKRTRILAQQGRVFQPVAVADVAYFFSDSKLTFLMTRSGEKRLVNEPLATLASELDESEFFRLTRNYHTRASAIRGFSSRGKGRLAVELQPRSPDEVIVSQENGAAFRTWVGG
jgi:DNA-binding LytR/AlgR family response regulator